jgi:hypothetical protein
MPGCGRSDPQTDTSLQTTAGSDDSGAPRSAAVPDTAADPAPKPATSTLRVYTAEPGWFVLVDGEPVRNDEGELQPTPCAVTVAAGNHSITIARPATRDISKVVTVEDEREVVFDESPLPDETGGLLSASYFNAKVGDPIALVALNSGGNEFDPFVTPDGLSIYFAAQRAAGNGVYVATRPSPYHEFESPELVLLSRSGDVPAAPSVTADGLTVVYGITDKARLFALTRTNPLTEFTDKRILQFSRHPAVVWSSAQILANGLRVYWFEDHPDGPRTLTTNRAAIDDEFSEQLLQVPLPGHHPCLSADGLRQYVFDGKILQRAMRSDVNARFSNLEVVANLSLPNFQPSARHRRYFVTDDEQWMFYSAPGEKEGSGADLYMVRLSAGRGWGHLPRGTGIPPRQVLAAKPEEDDAPSPARTTKPSSVPQPVEKPVDPRSLPLPYTTLHAKFTAMLAERNYAEARRIIEAAKSSPQLAGQRELLDWDVDDLRRIEGFWDNVQQALAALKPGDEVRYAGGRVEFVRTSDGVLVVRSRTSTIEKPLIEMNSGDLAALVDTAVDRDAAAAQTRIGTFLYYDGRGNRRSAEMRFKWAGAEGESLIARPAARLLWQAKLEFDRENMAAGLKFIEDVLANYPNSPTADQARELEQTLYKLVRWNPTGRRKWQQGAEGEYTADAVQAPDSYLLSPRQYENFQLQLEWKTTGRTGQGGVYFRYPGRGRPYDRAFKLHLANDYGLAPDIYSTGSLFAVDAPKSNAVHREGQWNTLLLRVEGERVQATINGRLVLDTTARDSKIPLKGHVALDGVVGGISYRKILLTELPPQD